MNSSWQHKLPDGQPFCWPMLTPPLTPPPSHSAASSGVNTPQPESSASLSSNPNHHFHVFNVVSHDINESPHQAGASVPDPNPPSLTDFTPQAEHVQQQHPQRQQSGSSGQKPVSPINEPILDKTGSDKDYARSRRMAQNRAAQRAFRERKEKYVEALKAKIAQLEAFQRQTSCENKRLKKDLQKMSIENAMLRGTPHISRSSLSIEPAGLIRSNPEDLSSKVVGGHTNKSPSSQIGKAIDDESLLTADAAWDLIIDHRLFKKGLIDIGYVTDLLKHWARYDGQGPVFSKRAIIRAIEKSVARCTDDLTWTVRAENEG
ncbi:AP-1-like transcription factor YAP1 [Fusarium oxysporum f. sp. raphani]|uniref:AP-1-like transcription factor YAP1 n=1 Tax=Fusarium oxysporum f. sp. raphani TaxID=96318 RepID=A0A8J5NHW3_FUSOX|nr:AP-1-like transcription factor YAP1 [Fusarium oxysporum f. sp. raphani]